MRRPASGRWRRWSSPPEPRPAHRRQRRPHRRRALARHADDYRRRRAPAPRHEVEAELKARAPRPTSRPSPAPCGATRPHTTAAFEVRAGHGGADAAPAPAGLLNGDEERLLTRISRRTDAVGRRARVLLALHEGALQRDAAARADMAPRTVRYWLNRFRREGLAIFPRRLVAAGSRRPVPAAPAGCARRRAARRRADDGRHRPGGAGGGREPREQEIAGQGKARPQALTGADGGRRGGRQDHARRGAGGGAAGGGATGRRRHPRRQPSRRRRGPSARRVRASGRPTPWPRRPSRRCASTWTACSSTNPARERATTPRSSTS